MIDRKQCLKAIARHVSDADIVLPVYSTAFDWIDIRPNPLNYLSHGAMGLASSHALGLALGRPDKETWAVVGDGGLQMTAQEMLTVVVDRIPVKVALMDNKKLGMIRQWQEIIYAGNYHSAHLFGPDYIKLCEAYGVAAFKATTPDQDPLTPQQTLGMLYGIGLLVPELLLIASALAWLRTRSG